MPAFYRAILTGFLASSESELTGVLATAHARSGFSGLKTSQVRAWIAGIVCLQSILDQVLHQRPSAAYWSVLLEFEVPRKERRIDVVLLVGDSIVILELKSGMGGFEAERQAEEYALLLHYFHQPSSNRKIIPLVITGSATRSRSGRQLFLPIVEAPAFWIQPVVQLTWNNLVDHLLSIAPNAGLELVADVWDQGEYRPVPNSIDAAVSLQAGLSLREIAHARAERQDVEALTGYIADKIDAARARRGFTICFVTGVPGSGKTLVGLNLVFSRKSQDDPIHFMSGTGPLVKVLQAAMAEHHRRRMQTTADEARMKAKTLIENVHVFARYYAEENTKRAPSNRVIIFDEAQRA